MTPKASPHVVNLGVMVHSFVLYLGFIVLFIWRELFPCRHWNKGWQKYINYFTLLYILLSVLFVSEVVDFIYAVRHDFNTTKHDSDNGWPLMWLRILALGAPLAVGLCLLMCFLQSRQHVIEIRENRARMLHERAISILACPVVFAIMALAALANVYVPVVDEGSAKGDDHLEADEDVAVAAFETCLHTGDVYEAFALYQFGVLTVMLLERSFAPRLPIETAKAASSSSGPAAITDEMGMAGQLAVSFNAVADVMWTGVFLFIAVAMMQSGWGIFLWVFKDLGNNWDEWEYSFDNFVYAGMIASAGAIYNVHAVEHTFGDFIEGYFAFLKFISVKLIVFFSFWQSGLIWFLMSSGICDLTTLQAKLLHATLLCYESVLVSVIHTFAWHVSEDWYCNFEEDDGFSPIRPKDEAADLRASAAADLAPGANPVARDPGPLIVAKSPS